MLAELQSLHSERVLHVDPARVRRPRTRGIAALLPLDSGPRPGPAAARGIRLDGHHAPGSANPRLGPQNLAQHGMTLRDAPMRVERRPASPLRETGELQVLDLGPHREETSVASA